MSTQLNTQEKAFLHTHKANLHTNEVKALLTQEKNAIEKAWERTQALATLVAEGMEWFRKEGKILMKAQGVNLSMETFLFHCYGLSKSYAFKLEKIGNTNVYQVERFEAECQRALAQGYAPKKGIDAYLSFLAKEKASGVVGETTEATPTTEATTPTEATPTPTEATPTEATPTEATTPTTDLKVQVHNKPIISVKLANVSFNVYEDLGKCKQDVSIEDIDIAIAKLQAFKSIVSKKQKKEAKKAHELSL